ncbi:MAG: NADH-quinone oxidoreductase subunit A [Alphaproteobacteria bacterium GM202ARS2]|nr:NADH-quinone oxidoreductase subunit A [Alphaproteobacteria bacterium GM202ARS2]
MPDIATDYVPIVIVTLLAFALSFGVLALSYLLGRQRPDKDKNAPYECGFEPSGDMSGLFHVRFYLVALLFIIFDLEIAFLFPWALVLADLGVFGFVSMMIFLAVLTVGFIYEWKKGALNWE